MGKSKDGNVTCFMYTQMRIVGLAEGEVIAKEQAVRLRAWGRLPVSVFSGLGVATVWTLNAVLSQPIAGYDYLTSRLYRSRIGACSRRQPNT